MAKLICLNHAACCITKAQNKCLYEQQQPKKKKERNSQQALTRNKQSILHKRFK